MDVHRSRPMLLVTKWFGCFLLDENCEIVEKRLFEKDHIPGILRRVMKGEVLEEEKELVAARNIVPKGCAGAGDAGEVEILVTEQRLVGIQDCKLADPTRMEGTRTGDIGGSESLAVLVERTLDPANFGYDPGMLAPLMEDAMAAKEKAAVSGATRDALISATVHTLEDMRQCSNLMTERLEEWHHVFSTKTLGKRKAAKLPEALMDAMPEEFLRNFGWENTRQIDLDLLTIVASNRKGMLLSMKTLEMFVRNEMESYAPNVSAIAGTQVGAALLAAAGSLKRLSMFPSGTVQLLGAEKAFFRFLKEGDRPPKHGFIYRIPAIRLAPKQLRGRLSRHYATKISIAARMDYFSPQKGLNREFLEEFKKKRAMILDPGQDKSKKK